MKRKFKLSKKYFTDGALIVFSVLFALFISKVTENIKVENEKKEALEKIRMEIRGNLQVVDVWVNKHSEILERLTQLSEGKKDSLRIKLLEFNYLNTYVLFNGQSLLHDIISQNAWETSKASGIIREFDFDTAQKLTKVYSLQETIMDKTITNLTNRLTATETHDMKKFDLNLLGLQFLMMELVGQELLLRELYQGIL
ncbi:hypothetical protein [Aquiflexum sp.]|uniref:hypothetical protein n=1 Tax=Aquiflexum sp. TaxID=1872584 RepID=UPI00359368CD